MIRRLYRAWLIYFRTDLTWSAALDQADDFGPYRVVARDDGHLYIEPR